MIVIEGLKDGPVKGDVCVLTLDGEGGVTQHFGDKGVIVGKWKALGPHGRLIDADALPIKDEWTSVGTNVIWDAPTVLEASE